MRHFILIFGLLFYAMPTYAQKTSGRLDGGKISSTIKASRGEIAQCYENVLKRRPNGEGKVIIRFVIAKNGQAKSAHIPKAPSELSFNISTVIKRERPKITMCYVDTLKRNPTANGKIVIVFTIAKDGKTKNAKVAQNSSSMHGVAVCVAKIIEGLKFDKPIGEISVKKSFVFEIGNAPPKKKKRDHLQIWLRTKQAVVNRCIVQHSKKPIPPKGKLVVKLFVKNKKLGFIKKVWEHLRASSRRMYCIRNTKMEGPTRDQGRHSGTKQHSL